ncbi:MAG: N-acetylmuramoyl-L-alanine amidase [Synergistaceae bacterium]|nr:N-acetylmuramoyl-L-alanine amidase [Synergistaceae bacterium]
MYVGSNKAGTVKTLNLNSKLYVSAQGVASIFGFTSSYSGASQELVMSRGRSQIRILMNSVAAWRDASLISLSSVPFEQDGICWLDTASAAAIFQRIAGAGAQNKIRFTASASSSSYYNSNKNNNNSNANQDTIIASRPRANTTRPEPVILPSANANTHTEREPVILPSANSNRPEPIILPPEDSQAIITPQPQPAKPSQNNSLSPTLIDNPEEFMKHENSRPRQAQSEITPKPVQQANLNLGEVYRVRWSFTGNHNRVRAVIDASDKAEPAIKISQDGTASALFASAKSDSIEGGVSPYENLTLSTVKRSSGVELIFKASGLKNVEKLILSSPRRVVFDFFFNKDVTVRRSKLQAQAQPEITPQPVITQPEVTQPRVPRNIGGRKTIVVDPGHGGKDPGTAANGVTEKNVNLSVGLLLERELKALGFNVIMTRRTDVYLKLQERTDIANNAKADVFVSVHVNALPSAKKTSGFEIYIMALPTDKDALNLAKIENREYVEGKAAANNNAEVDKRTELLLRILGDMQQNNKINESTELAEALFKAGNGSSLPMKRVAQAPFFVLRGAGMPAVLLETGFVTNETEAKLLAHPGYQERIAKAMAAGVADYLK